MPKIDWYEWRAGRDLPPHAEYSPTKQTVYIRLDDPYLVPYVSLGHELAHIRLDMDSSLAGEIEVWTETVYNLMRAGEWTPEAKEQVIWALSSYTEAYGAENPVEEARAWVDRIEQRARQRLSRR